jgi:hypothetical protein
VKLVHSPLLVDTWIWLKPRDLGRLFYALLPKAIRVYYDFINAQVVKRKLENEKDDETGVEEEKRRRDVLYHLLKQKYACGKPAYSTAQLFAEANLLIIAGKLIPYFPSEFLIP